jgi:hypothetical protein
MCYLILATISGQVRFFGGQSGAGAGFLWGFPLPLPILFPPKFTGHPLNRRYTLSIQSASLNNQFKKDAHCLQSSWLWVKTTKGFSSSFRNVHCLFFCPLHIQRITYLVTDFYTLVPFFPYKMRQGKRSIGPYEANFPRLHAGHLDVTTVMRLSLVLFPTDVTVMRQGIWRHFTGDVGSLETGFNP